VSATCGDEISAGQSASHDSKNLLAPQTLVSQPYWLREEGTAGMFRVDDSKLIGRPENPPVFPVDYVFEVGGQTLVVATEPVQLVPGASQTQPKRKLVAIPPVALNFPFEVALFAPGATKSVVVEVTAARAGVGGAVRLDPPAAWRISPTNQTFALKQIGDKARFTF